MAATRRRSSLTQLIGNIVSRPLNSVRTDIDLTALESDLLVSYQLALDNPSELGTEAFYEAKVVPNKDFSARVNEALCKIGILVKPSNDRLSIDTSKITRNFPSQMPFCSAFVLRRIVSLLFVFEEQVMRWRLLDQEKKELNRLLSHPPEGMRAELQLRLRAVDQKKALLPSQQSSDGGESGLPAYSQD